MKKADYTELARLGVRQKIEQMQRYLANLFAEFPEEFATTTPPIFLRPKHKSGGNSWPAFTATTPEDGNGHASLDLDETDETDEPARTWTAKQRAAHAVARKGQPKVWGDLGWQRLHDYLLKQPDHVGNTTTAAKALKMPASSVVSAVHQHDDLFKRDGRGGIRLKKVIPTNTRKAVGARPLHAGTRTSPKTWGDAAWHRIHDFLAGQEHQTAKLQDIMKATKTPTQASAITGMTGHREVFERTAPGFYHLKRELSADEKTAATR